MIDCFLTNYCKNHCFITIFQLLSFIFYNNIVRRLTPNVIQSFSLRRISDVCKRLTSLSVSFARFQPIGKAEIFRPLKKIKTHL